MRPSHAAPPPRVSVVIPTRNRAALLRRALESVFAQGFVDHEVLVVDDASTDDTAALLAGWPDPRLRVLRQPAAGGGPRARNRGIEASRGEFVAFLDDDDEWLPRKLALQVARFDAPGPPLVLVHCGTDLVSARSGRLVHRFDVADRPMTCTDFLRELPFTTSNAMVRRSSLQAIGGFDETLAGAQDRDLWIRLARIGAVGAVPEVLLRRYLHGEQISSSLSAKLRAKEQFLAKYREDLRRHPREHALHLWRLGVLYCVAGRVREARRALLLAVCTDPGRLDALRDLGATLRWPRDCVRRIAERRVSRVDGIPNYY
ncbi:MAG: glycosyltransferase family 2 protein [Steroidobacteraceae bacterium]|nr:glycosyltransferase family 2 protein [Steroidobacteraceae bacterium]